MKHNKYRDCIQMMYDPVDMPGGWKFNHIKTLRKIDLFYTSHYETGEYDDQGFFKFFFNVVKAPCDVASKFIDIDIQNIRFLPRPSMENDVTTNEMCVYYLGKDFKVYADQNKLGSLMNQLGDDLPKYGSIFVKDVRGVPRRVAVHNIKFDPSAPRLKDSMFVAEPYLMRKAEIMRMGSKWNQLAKNADELFTKRNDDGDLFLIYEFYENYGTSWKREIVADVFCWKDSGGHIIRSLESNVNYEGEDLPPIVLHEDKHEMPIYDHKWEHVDGRLLGYGNVDYLIHDQIATNEAENLERKGLYYSSLVLLQSRESGMGGKNVLTDAKNGDILLADSELLKVPLEERNLAAYNATRQRWDSNLARKTFSQDIATGGNLPSRTPLGVANLQANMTASFYDKKREGYGMFWKDDILSKIVIPSFKEKTAKEHILTIGSTEKDIEEYEKFIAKIFVDKSIADYAEKHGYFPSKPQRMLIEDQVLQSLKSQKYKSTKIRDYYYDNAAYKMEIDITGEGVDTGVKSALIEKSLGILGANPAILQNQTTRTVFLRLLSIGGITPQELGIDLSNIDMTLVQPGGSVAAGQPGAMPATNTLA
ncbi:MAG: hypothetical protein AAB875_00500 [Patescibacteria group bacterium]